MRGSYKGQTPTVLGGLLAQMDLAARHHVREAVGPESPPEPQILNLKPLKSPTNSKKKPKTLNPEPQQA